MYVSHLLNCLPSVAIRNKTLMDVLYEKPAKDCDSLHVFWFSCILSCYTYREKNALVMGISSSVKRYHLDYRLSTLGILCPIK